MCESNELNLVKLCSQREGIKYYLVKLLRILEILKYILHIIWLKKDKIYVDHPSDVSTLD